MTNQRQGDKNMGYKIKRPQNYLSMDPLELMGAIEQDMDFNIPDNVETKENQKIASDTLTKATAYATYFTEMETKARLMKRTAKTSKNKEEYERLIGVEDVFKSYKEIAKLQIENVAKIMTLRRLDLDEQKNNGRIT